MRNNLKGSKTHHASRIAHRASRILNYFNYFTEIEETFIRRRGRNLLLSPLDWALIESWQQRNVPLHIILRGIETVFDGVDKQPPNRRRNVKSLFYCKEEIEAQYTEWLETQVGKNGDAEVLRSELQVSSAESENANRAKDELFPKEIIDAHLKKVTAALELAGQKAEGGLQETLDKVLSYLAKLDKKSYSSEELAESLEKLDQLIDESLLQTAENKKLSALKSETAKQLTA